MTKRGVKKTPDKERSKNNLLTKIARKILLTKRVEKTLLRKREDQTD